MRLTAFIALLVPALVTEPLLAQPARSPARDSLGKTAAGIESEVCHVAFSRPADWRVVPDTVDPGDGCRFSVRPLDWQQRLVEQDSIDTSTIWLHIASRGVWRFGPDSPFERRDGGWVVLGRHGIEQPADTVSGAGWTGLRGTAVQGCYRVEGAYAGICSQLTALVGTGGRSVLLIGGPRSEEAFEQILATLRFKP